MSCGKFCFWVGFLTATPLKYALSFIFWSDNSGLALFIEFIQSSANPLWSFLRFNLSLKSSIWKCPTSVPLYNYAVSFSNSTVLLAFLAGVFYGYCPPSASRDVTAKRSLIWADITSLRTGSTDL